MKSQMKSISNNIFLKMISKKYQEGQRFCFILGAGASRSSGIYTGEEIMCQWREELQKYGLNYIQENAMKANIPWEECEKLFNEDYELRNEDYFTLYDLRFIRNPMEGYKFLEDLMENKVPNIGYFYLGCILKYTENHLVITTNFDHLLEDSLHQLSGRHPLVLGHEWLASFMDNNLERRPVIAKIHRDLLLHPMNRSKEMMQLQEEWGNPLSIALTRYIPIVIGYAGGDQTLMRLLGKLRMNGIFWCTRSESEPPESAKMIIENNKGQWVKINDFDTLMYQLVQCIPEARRSWEPDCNLNNAIEETDTPIDALTLNLEEEVEKRTRAIELEPDNAFLYYLRGIALHKMGRLSDALADKSKAIRLEPNNASFYRSRSMTSRAMKNYEAANADKTKAVALIPDDAWLYHQRGLALHQNGLYKDALEAKTKAISLEPDHASFYLSRSATYKMLGLSQKSQLDIRMAEEIERRDS